MQRSRFRTATLVLTLAFAAAPAGCRPGPAPAPAPPSVEDAWTFVPARPVAWARADLAALREDARLAAYWRTLVVDEIADGPLSDAVRAADALTIAWSDPDSTQRVHVLDTTFDTAALEAALADGSALSAGAFSPEPVSTGRMWTTPAHAWAVAALGDRWLITGDRAMVRAGLLQASTGTGPAAPVEWRHAVEGHLVVAPSHRALLEAVVGRPEVAAPLQTLTELSVSVDMGIGADIVVDLSVEDPEQAPALRVLIALAARSLRDAGLPDGVEAALMRARLDTIGPETRRMVRVALQLGPEDVDAWLAALAPDGARPESPPAPAAGSATPPAGGSGDWTPTPPPARITL